MQAQEPSKQQMKKNNDNVTYPRAIIKAENLYEMAVRKRLGEGKRAWSLYGFKEGLLLELPPK